MKTIIAAALILLPASTIFASELEKKVSTVAYKDIAIHITHNLGGVVPATQESNISAQISAIIKYFHVDTGAEVKKGDLLASLGCQENMLKLKQADASLKAEKSQLSHAKIQFNQAEKLNKQGNISQQLYNQRDAEVNRLQATLENRKAIRSLAQLHVDRCQIKAPFDGYITHRHASIGELTQIGTHLLQLISKENNMVEVKINHDLFTSFSHGKNHRFVLNNKSYPLELNFILPLLDSKTRNHTARLRFIDEPAITGGVGKILWQEAGLSIPSRFLVLRNNKLGIFIAEHKVAKFISIDSAREGHPVTIILDAETQIISNGRFNVQPGDSLIITKQGNTRSLSENRNRSENHREAIR